MARPIRGLCLPTTLPRQDSESSLLFVCCCFSQLSRGVRRGSSRVADRSQLWLQSTDTAQRSPSAQLMVSQPKARRNGMELDAQQSLLVAAQVDFGQAAQRTVRTEYGQCVTPFASSAARGSSCKYAQRRFEGGQRGDRGGQREPKRAIQQPNCPTNQFKADCGSDNSSSLFLAIFFVAFLFRSRGILR